MWNQNLVLLQKLSFLRFQVYIEKKLKKNVFLYLLRIVPGKPRFCDLNLFCLLHIVFIIPLIA